VTAATVIPEEEVERLRKAQNGARDDRWKDENADSDADVRDRERARAFLDEQFFAPKNLKLEGALRLGRRQTRWFVDVRDPSGALHEKVSLGRTCDVRVQERVRDAIQEATGESIPRVKTPKWDKFRDALYAVSAVEDHGATGADEAREWIAEFGRGDMLGGVVDLGDPEALAVALGYEHWNDGDWHRGRPRGCFRGSDGCLYLHLTALLKYVTREHARTTRGDLLALLRGLDFEPAQPSARVGGKVVKARLWRSAPAFDPEGGS